MAFTNYIMHSVICTLVFFGYGLNYFAELEFYQLYFVALAIWVLQLIISPLWLRSFLFGPLGMALAEPNVLGACSPSGDRCGMPSRVRSEGPCHSRASQSPECRSAAAGIGSSRIVLDPEEVSRMLFMVIERFKDRNPGADLRPTEDQGRSMPEGLKYIESWIEVNFERCFQLMECDDAAAPPAWILQWRGHLMEFGEIVPVSPSKVVREMFSPSGGPAPPSDERTAFRAALARHESGNRCRRHFLPHSIHCAPGRMCERAFSARPGDRCWHYFRIAARRQKQSGIVDFLAAAVNSHRSKREPPERKGAIAHCRGQFMRGAGVRAEKN